MKKESTAIAKVTIISLGLIILCGLTYFLFTRIKSGRETNKLIAFAERLRYTPEVHLIQYDTRWGIFPTSHGKMLYYTTESTLEELQKQIESLAGTESPPTDSDGYDLFSVNLSSDHTITINGIGDSTDRSKTPEPLAYRWELLHDNAAWTITYYQISNDGNVYHFDNSVIDDNIITILLITD